MKITIDIPPLTHEFLSNLVRAGEYASIDDATESCFNDGLARMYEHYKHHGQEQ